MRLIPFSNGEDASPLHEFNPCHSPDDGKFCSGSKFSAGKMPMEGRTPNGYGISVHVSHNSIQVDAGPRTIAQMLFLNGHTPGKLTRVTTSQVASEFQRKGWGAWLYKRAAQAAIEAGATGIWSSGHGRNHLSDRVWAALERKGLAEKLESKGGRDIYRMPPAGGVKKLREYNACHSPDDGKFCSGEKTPGGMDRAAKVQRHKDLLEEIRPLAQKRGGGLTASEAAVFERKMLELEGLRFDLAKPFDGSKVRSAEERMSTLSVETIGAARGDLLRNKDIYLAIAQGAIGVHYSKTTAIDNIMDGKNPKVSAEAFYENFAATRDALRAQYGDTMTLYRATGKQIAKATQNWATTFEFAAQFGPNVVKRKVPVDAIIAVNVSANGIYHELIVNARVIREANPCHSPENGRFCSGAGSFAMSGLDDTSALRMLDKGAVWYSFEQGGDWRATHAGSVTITPTLQRKIAGLYSPARGTFGTTSQAALLKRALDVPERKGYLTVYRIAKSGTSLNNRNAANLMGIATFMNQSIGDGRSLTGLSLHAYYVKTKGAIAEGPRHYRSFDRETR